MKSATNTPKLYDQSTPKSSESSHPMRSIHQEILLIQWDIQVLFNKLTIAHNLTEEERQKYRQQMAILESEEARLRKEVGGE